MWPFSAVTHTRLPTTTAADTGDTTPTAAAAAPVDAHDAAALAALHADAAHWSEARLCSLDEGLYFAKRDPRLCVRKRSRALSWTLNFGHPRALAAILAFIVGSSAVPLLINAFAISRLKRC